MKFLKDKAQENCSKVKGRELVVDQDGLHNSTTQEALVEAFGGPITFLPREQMEQAFLAGGSEKAVLFPVPVGAINNAQGSMPDATYAARWWWIPPLAKC
ncbi:MAG: hypothetical protein H6596_02080 [Flavobacteriales bacterium]|nr:hypothetical protein [Flavobacteriales bacterium]